MHVCMYVEREVGRFEFLRARYWIEYRERAHVLFLGPDVGMCALCGGINTRDDARAVRYRDEINSDELLGEEVFSRRGRVSKRACSGKCLIPFFQWGVK